MKNFHLPLPEGTCAELLTEAERAQLPATTVAREAIAFWLQARKKMERQNTIAAYAAEMAELRRGDVYWADLVPRSGSEQAGRRGSPIDPDTRAYFLLSMTNVLQPARSEA